MPSDSTTPATELSAAAMRRLAALTHGPVRARRPLTAEEREDIASHLAAAAEMVHTADILRQQDAHHMDVTAKLDRALTAARADIRALQERLGDSRANWQAIREQILRGETPDTRRDACQFCLGVKGGEPGKEQIVGGALACAECADLVQAAIENATPVAAIPIADDAATDLWRVIQEAGARAAAIAQQEAVGERVSLVTSIGGTVTDPDELEMHRQLKAQNIAVCARCRNVGWLVEGSIFCSCPYGEFLAKKIRASETIPGEEK